MNDFNKIFDLGMIKCKVVDIGFVVVIKVVYIVVNKIIFNLIKDEFLVLVEYYDILFYV